MTVPDLYRASRILSDFAGHNCRKIGQETAGFTGVSDGARTRDDRNHNPDANNGLLRGRAPLSARPCAGLVPGGVS